MRPGQPPTRLGIGTRCRPESSRTDQAMAPPSGAYHLHAVLCVNALADDAAGGVLQVCDPGQAVVLCVLEGFHLVADQLVPLATNPRMASASEPLVVSASSEKSAEALTRRIRVAVALICSFAATDIGRPLAPCGWSICHGNADYDWL